VVVSAVRDAIRLLRDVAGLVEGEKGHAASCEFCTAADALERLVTDPPAEEVERLADEFRENRIVKDEHGRWGIDADNGIRAVLRALGDQP
jgi:hypothetical protein